MDKSDKVVISGTNLHRIERLLNHFIEAAENHDFSELNFVPDRKQEKNSALFDFVVTLEKFYNKALETAKIKEELEQYFLQDFYTLSDIDNLKKQKIPMISIFIDIKDSTKIMEKQDKLQNVLRIINIFSYLLEQIKEYVIDLKGDFIKPLGDGILVAFKDDKLENSYTFLQMLQTVAQLVKMEANQRIQVLEEKFKISYEELDLSISAGASYGPVHFGTYGDKFRHIDIYGISVNKASRIQSLNSLFNTYTLADEEYVTELFKRYPQKMENPHRKKVYPVKVKGIRDSFYIYDLYPVHENEITSFIYQDVAVSLDAIKNNDFQLLGEKYPKIMHGGSVKGVEILKETLFERLQDLVNIEGSKDMFVAELIKYYQSLYPQK